jgi:hypothetical protein
MPYPNASILLPSLVMLSSILATLLLGWDKVEHYHQADISQYQTYLSSKFHIGKISQYQLQQQCQNEKKEQNYIVSAKLKLAADCLRYSIFPQTMPASKYLKVDNLNDRLDLTRFEQDFIKIETLDELPQTSAEYPKIVLASAPINARLLKDFYGVIATDYEFNVTDKKIYGVLISSYDNSTMGQKRNLTFKRDILNRLEELHSEWEFLPNSIRIEAND